MRSLFTLLSLFLIGVPPATGQGVTRVAVRTNVPDAIVFADSVQLGKADAGIFVVPSDAKTVRLVAPGSDNWSVPPVVADLPTPRPDSLTLDLFFPRYYRIETVPFGAEVFIEQDGGLRRIGQTPFTWASDEPLTSPLILRRSGYVEGKVIPGDQLWNRSTVMLNPVPGIGEATAEVNWKPPRKHKNWVDYAALGLAAVSGAFAIHNKILADNRYDEYTATQNGALRSQVKSHDTRAALGLVGLQAGLGVFAFRLAFR